MSELAIHHGQALPVVGPLAQQAVPVPSPKVAINIRAGEMRDVPFLDALQKMHTKQVGWMPTKQFEGKIAAGHVLIAEEIEPQRHGDTEACSNVDAASVTPCLRGKPVGYCIGNDRYFKRDDVGIIYQMNVLPGRQRSFVGAALLKAMFERSAYGCRLYCCWCAQDIAANRFWESMGFVPLAFRTGSAAKGPKGPTGSRQPRVHIFWQKRIRAGDTTTPFWFPSQTGSGSIREDRLVLPIPPGTHWSDAKPILLPSATGRTEDSGLSSTLTLRPEGRTESMTKKARALPGPKATQTSALGPQSSISLGGLRFAAEAPKPGAPKPKREPKPKAKNDPGLVAAARELRDRWLEQVNADPSLLLSQGKYDLSRAIAGGTAMAMLAAPKAA